MAESGLNSNKIHAHEIFFRCYTETNNIIHLKDLICGYFQFCKIISKTKACGQKKTPKNKSPQNGQLTSTNPVNQFSFIVVQKQTNYII